MEAARLSPVIYTGPSIKLEAAISQKTARQSEQARRNLGVEVNSGEMRDKSTSHRLPSSHRVAELSPVGGRGRSSDRAAEEGGDESRSVSGVNAECHRAAQIEKFGLGTQQVIADETGLGTGAKGIAKGHRLGILARQFDQGRGVSFVAIRSGQSQGQ